MLDWSTRNMQYGSSLGYDNIYCLLHPSKYPYKIYHLTFRHLNERTYDGKSIFFRYCNRRLRNHAHGIKPIKE